MPSVYLAPADYGAYGLTGISPGQVQQASTLIDNYLNRSEGMAYSPDSFGRPAYMSAALPGMTLTLATSINPGRNIVISVPFVSYDLIGETFILDRATPNLCEPVSVVGVNPTAGTITLSQVLRAHASGALLEAGLVITEERALPASRSIARVSRPGMAALLSAAGRYGYGRRSDSLDGAINELNLLATLQTLGGQALWNPIDVTTVSISPTTGECWIPAGLLLAYFSEVRLRYVAGFPANAVPAAVKQATANVVNNLATAGDMSPIYKVVQAGGSKMERFSNSYIDADTQTLLSSYKLRLFV